MANFAEYAIESAGVPPAQTNADAFGYNDRSEVVFSHGATENTEYSYDGIGNLLTHSNNCSTSTYTANCLNQYTSISNLCASVPPCEFSYDADGNLLSDGVFTYAYDSENRLLSVTSATLTNGAIRVLNAHDAQGRRIRKTVQRLNSTTPPPPSPPTGTQEWQTVETRTFVYDDWNLAHETISAIDGGATNITEMQYLWGLDLSGALQGAGGVGGLLAVSVSNTQPTNSSTPPLTNYQIYFPCYDNNGNATKYLDEQSTVVASYTYDTFGNTIAQSGSMADIFCHRFSTKYFDVETGLYYYGYRFYSPELMRWINRDPIEEEGGENLYAFCRDNPVEVYDALGLSVDKSGFKNYGAVTEERYQALYKSAIGVPGESPFATDSYGFTSAIVKYSAKVVSCGSGKCYKLIVAADVSLSGSMAWKLFLDYYDPDSGLPIYNKNWQYRGRSGRSVKDHELEHLRHAEYHAENADLMLHLLADGKCVSQSCARTKHAYLRTFTGYLASVRNHDDAELDYEDYPLDSLGDLTGLLTSAVEKMQARALELEIAMEAMEMACSK